MPDLTGQVFVARTSGLAGWIIRVGTRSAWNHCGVITSEGGDTVEAQPPKVTEGRLSRYKHTMTSSFPLTDEQRAAIVKDALATVGLRYGWLDIIACALRALGIHSGWVERRAASSSTADCSCDVARIYRDARVPYLDFDKPDYAVTPGDIADKITHTRVPEDW